MELTYEDLDDGVRRVRLAGRMDVEGSREIDLKFTSLTASRQAFIIVDLALVDFLSSLGLGTLVRSAKAQMSRQGRMVNPLDKEPPAIPASLEEAGVGGWGIPIVHALADDLSYERRDGRNRFTIISRERPSPS